MNCFRLYKQSFIRAVAVTLALLLFSAVGLPGQSTTSGTITGLVTDSSGAVIPDATITVTDLSTKETRTTVSTKDGLYVLQDIPPGTYSVTAVKSGFSEGKVTSLTVSVATQTTANFRMKVGAENTVVEVQATNADLQTLNASTGQTVDPVVVNSLPAINRDVASFLTLQPGVTPGGNSGGTTQDQATFQLDGGSNSSDMDGTQSVYTGSFANSTTGGFTVGGNSSGPGGVMPMPQDSIEEFKVTSTGQTADFNNSSGSQSQIVTKRGHDHWNGTVYEYYLDSNIGANLWQNNFQNAYTPKASYHYSRFGAAAGGPIAPYKWGGRTYFFANYEGFRYPAAATLERAVPSYEYLQLGQLSFGGTTYSPSQLTAYDPRHIGFDTTLQNFYNTQLPVAPSGDNGSVPAYPGGTFDKSCGALSGSICDSVNVIGYKSNIRIPQNSDFLATRVDHDFGSKWHLMASYRYFNLRNLTSNQVDIGGVLSGDKVGVPTALTPRPQKPWFFVVGLTTNISPTLTNDFHYSYLRNYWQWFGAGAPPQVTGAGGALEPLGESLTTVLSPYNVNAQNIRTRIWDGKDNFFSDNLSKLKGDHFIQFGGQFQHNFNYHQRTDNGASINYTPTYQLGDAGGGGNISYTSNGTGTNCTLGLGCAGGGTAAYARIMDTYFGMVTDTQVADTYSDSGGSLTLNPPYTPIGAHTTIPYYNLYATDTWHAKSSLTINYGLSYAIEMPPTERDGNQVMLTDVSGNAIRVQQWLAQRKIAAQTGSVYNPEIGFALLHNVVGGRKYPYDPYYAALSPRLSFAWNPRFKNEGLAKIFGDGATVIRGGYGRIYGRINGDVQVLNPLLSPGLILATQCKYVQSPNTGSGACTQTNYNDTTAFRFGPPSEGGGPTSLDGLAPTLASAPAPTQLSQPYHPGFDGPGVAIASPVDPSLKPNDVDTFNFSIQRQIGRKMLIEVGYIGRLIHNEYIMMNPNQIPYNLSVGGQSFESAYLALEGYFGCTTSASLCAKSPTPTATTTNIAPQPFFEAVFANTGYCTGYANCTTAVAAKRASNFRAQQVFSLWQALDNNVNGAGGVGWNLPRSLMGTTTSNATYGSAGQIVTGVSMGTSAGWGNYHGGYVSFKTSGFHGLTLQENFTFAKALGLGSYNQSTSSITAEDSFNLHQQYGRQQFDQKVIFNTFIVYETPWYHNQAGIIGRLAGGWVFSPVLVAGTGSPLTCTTNNSGQNFGGEDGSNFTDNENCIFTTPLSGMTQTHRGVVGGTDSNGVAIATTPKGPGPASVNIFTNPVAVFGSVRPPILGLDARDGGYGAISGLGYLNLDLSVKKTLAVWEKTSLEFTGVFYNFMNHLDFSNPSLSLQSSANWGLTKTQGNSPREIQMGVRANF